MYRGKSNIIIATVNTYIMTNEAQAKIQKLIYNVTTENRAAAGRELKDILDTKIREAFRREYEQITQSFKENK